MIFKIPVKISANARKNEIVGWQGERLKIKIKAPAVDGKANAALLKFLAELAGVHQNEITIVHGETSTTKLLAFHSIDPSAIFGKMELLNPEVRHE